MRAAIFCSFLLMANVSLVCANLVLSSALKSAQADLAESTRRENAEALQALRRETAHLLAERTRLASVARPHAATEEPLPPSTTKPAGGTGGLVEPEGAAEPSRTLEVPLLDEEEKNDLVERRDRITNRPAETLLLQESVDDLVGDPTWNSKGRLLTAAELDEISQLMAMYRYYTRTSPVERFRRVIQPALARMAEAGAFIEYPAGEPEGLPPPVASDGTVVYSVSDRSPTPGYRRLFYFYPSDYPEIYHEEAVEQERSLETYVRIYELVNEALE